MDLVQKIGLAISGASLLLNLSLVVFWLGYGWGTLKALKTDVRDLKQFVMYGAPLTEESQPERRRVAWRWWRNGRGQKPTPAEAEK